MRRSPDRFTLVYTSDPVERNHPLNQGLLSWWLPLPALSGGKSLYDILGLYPATLTNMASGSGWTGVTRSGGFGALAFDGVDDYALVTNRSVFSGMSELTVSAWVYQRSAGGGSTGRIISKGTLDPWECYSSVSGSNGQPTFYTNGNFYNVGSFALSTWTHLAFVYSVAANIKAIYVNGVSAGSTTPSGALNSNTDDIRIGNLATRTDRGFDGFLDDIQLRTIALSAAGVRALYEESLCGYLTTLRRGSPRSIFLLRASGTTYTESASGGVILSSFLTAVGTYAPAGSGGMVSGSSGSQAATYVSSGSGGLAGGSQSTGALSQRAGGGPVVGAPAGTACTYSASAAGGVSLGSTVARTSRLGYTLFQYNNLAYSNTLSVIEQGGGYLVCGGAGPSPADIRMALARYSTTGQLDTSFGSGGVYLVPHYPGSTQEVAYTLLVDGSGKILLAGNFGIGGVTATFGIVRLNSDLTLDTSFGSGGYVSLTPGVTDFAHALAIDGSGKILVAGDSYASGFTTRRFVVVRLSASDGSLDTSFNTTGIATATIPSYDLGQCFGMALQSDGKIVLAGLAVNSAATDETLAAVRFNTDGSLDTGFASSGYFTYRDTTPSLGVAVVIDGSGKILLTGGDNVDLSTGQAQTQLLLRLDSAGALDSSFGSGGVVRASILNGLPVRQGVSLRLQSDGKIVVYSQDKYVDEPVHLVRYNTDGTLDRTFGPSATGALSWILPAHTMYMSDPGGLLIRGDDSIVAAGTYSTQASNTRSFLLHLSASGQWDTAFGDLVPGVTATYLPSGTGGALAGSAGTVTASYSVSSSGGASAGSAASTAGTLLVGPRGGVVLGSQGTVAGATQYTEAGKGGVLLGNQSTTNATYLWSSSAGAVLGSTSTAAFALPPLSGGVLAGSGSAAAGTVVISPSGGSVLGSPSSWVCSYAWSGSAGLVLGSRLGTALFTQPSGGVLAGASVSPVSQYIVSPSGGWVLGAQANVVAATQYQEAGQGGVLLGSSSTSLASYTWTARAGVVLGSRQSAVTAAQGSGGALAGGSGSPAVHHSISPSGGAVLGSQAAIQGTIHALSEGGIGGFVLGSYATVTTIDTATLTQVRVRGQQSALSLLVRGTASSSRLVVLGRLP